jgi:hypothetical protein
MQSVRIVLMLIVSIDGGAGDFSKGAVMTSLIALM